VATARAGDPDAGVLLAGRYRLAEVVAWDAVEAIRPGPAIGWICSAHTTVGPARHPPNRPDQGLHRVEQLPAPTAVIQPVDQLAHHPP